MKSFNLFGLKWPIVGGTVSMICVPIVSVVSCGFVGDEVSIIGIGSNSITPIINSMNTKTIYNLEYSNTGSGNGVKAMSKSNITVDFGMVSSKKVPQLSGETDDGLEALTNWNNNKVRTVTFAIDAMSVGLNLPQDIEQSLDGERPTIDISELAKLYTVGDTVWPTWEEIIIDDISSADSKNIVPTPIGITGGKSTSGKAEAFINKLWDALPEENKEIENEEDFENHASSPSKSMDIVADNEATIYNKNDSKVNSIAYHALGFIIENDKINNKVGNITYAKIDFNDSSEIIEPTIESVQDGSYKWTRPFNVLYSVENEKSINFVEMILSKEVNEAIIENLNYVSLSDTLIDLQTDVIGLDQSDEIANKHDGVDYGLEV